MLASSNCAGVREEASGASANPRDVETVSFTFRLHCSFQDWSLCRENHVCQRHSNAMPKPRLSVPSFLESKNVKRACRNAKGLCFWSRRAKRKRLVHRCFEEADDSHLSLRPFPSTRPRGPKAPTQPPSSQAKRNCATPLGRGTRASYGGVSALTLGQSRRGMWFEV